MKKRAQDTCKECGLTREEHHEFIAWKQVPQCQCNPNDWRSWPPAPICATFTGDARQNCTACEHGIECHKTAPTNARKDVTP